jgi:hypothetical protein
MTAIQAHGEVKSEIPTNHKKREAVASHLSFILLALRTYTPFVPKITKFARNIG